MENASKALIMAGRNFNFSYGSEFYGIHSAKRGKHRSGI